jgi:hypothetical protein
MENYGRTDTGELIGPYDTVDELNRELADSNAWNATHCECNGGNPCACPDCDHEDCRYHD